METMDTFELIQRLAVALAIGLLIGIERGWQQRKEAEGERAVGLRTHALAGLLVSVYFAASGWAQTPGPDEFFEMRVRPVLAANCFACHTASKMGGLQMESRESLLAGGGRGPAVVPGDPERSLLIQAVTYSHAEVTMPPGGKLKPQEIEDLASWIKAGAKWPETIVSSVAGKPDAKTITAEQRNFWAFRPVRKPALPSVRNEAWVRNRLIRKRSSAGRDTWGRRLVSIRSSTNGTR